MAREDIFFWPKEFTFILKICTGRGELQLSFPEQNFINKERKPKEI